MASGGRRTSTSDRRSLASRRSSSSIVKSEVYINVYDLLPPGKVSSALWFLGSSLLHTGVVIKSLKREFAFGGHSHPNLSGVYSTPPGLEPPGGTFRCSLLQGLTLRAPREIEAVIVEVSRAFPGTSYNLLTNNCNHFSSFLCEKLTGRAAPSWMNRAATIGIVLPCIVPKEWVEPPDADSAEGELLVQEEEEEEEEEEEDERAAMLRKTKRSRPGSFQAKFGSEDPVSWRVGRRRSSGQGRMTDTDGRAMPVSERAPEVQVH
ncbi:MAG: hypothetical protein LQ348_000679 [Seirophora lacunosa]|nr:MAG: hypothetical protein LQ348_000679 [Seirophora lacunosa]